MKDLMVLAHAEGFWNLFLPSLHVDEPDKRLSNLDYAPLAEIMGRFEPHQLANLRAAWRLDQGQGQPQVNAFSRSDVSAIKVVAARLQTSVVNRAMQVFGAMGLSPDTPLAYFWTWGRALHLLDGPDEVHLRAVARHELDLTRKTLGSRAAYFTTPEQLQAEPRIR